MAERTVRDEKIIVKVSPEIKAKLQEHCEEMGVSMSGYIAVLIGQTLKQSTMAEKAMLQVVNQMTKEGFQVGMEMAKADQ